MVNSDGTHGNSLNFGLEETADDDFDEYPQRPGKKRRLTADQVEFLEKNFEVENKLEPERKLQLAKDLGLKPRQVAIWFQNRRARWKAKQLEKGYESLKSSYDSLKLDHDNLVKENEKLQAELQPGLDAQVMLCKQEDFSSANSAALESESPQNADDGGYSTRSQKKKKSIGFTMEYRPQFFFFSSLLFFLASAAFTSAHIADYDEYWQKKAELARSHANNAYNPNPESVTKHFNEAVMRCAAELETNSTRRGLRGKLRNQEDSCLATNPIDRCFRCLPNWVHHRKKLATCAKGFGRHATGGKNGDFYVVTDSSDDDLVNPRNGTLRHAVIQDRPLWIVFARDMLIRLTEELIINSNKTIDGRGANVQIANGAGLTLQFVHNVIIHNIRIHDIKAGNGGMIRDSEEHYGLRTRSDGDGISIFGASNIWIDHVSMSNCMDGLIDAIEGSTAITISNCHFTQHNDVG
ncbi:hypothetical protein BHE74_00035601 [Ensete ventricosum]|nr:hypothetical protein GW17_00048827 [Ensete ventricosum]RWW57582.1 hypothetical protein BHE74_00035601 [Ensete ventricosum]